jgi:hypothetical protein
MARAERAAQGSGAADVFVVSCIDPRFTRQHAAYLAELGGTDRYSELRIPGAALALADEAAPAATVLLDSLAASRQLHGVRAVLFLNHRDCGAVGIWAGRNLTADRAEETRVHADLVARAARIIRARHPDLAIRARLVGRAGDVKAIACPHCDGPGASAARPARAMADRFADFVALHRRAIQADRAAEAHVLQTGIAEYGVPLADARMAVAAALSDSGAGTIDTQARGVAAALRAARDRRGRVRPADFRRAAALYRRLSGDALSLPEAERQVAAILQAEGLAPAPAGLPPFRSTRWFRRIADRT